MFLVKNFLDPDSVSVVHLRYLENALRRYPENNQGGGQGDSSKISYYADPLIEMILTRQAGACRGSNRLRSSFPRTRLHGFTKRAKSLNAHVDRPACEISLTCHIATVGKPWPVWMQTPGGEPTGNTPLNRATLACIKDVKSSIGGTPQQKQTSTCR
jgi:hypothetical protein